MPRKIVLATSDDASAEKLAEVRSWCVMSGYLRLIWQRGRRFCSDLTPAVVTLEPPR
jgi:hypothetical protein